MNLLLQNLNSGQVISSIYMGRDVYVGDGKNTAALGLGDCPECHPYGRDLRYRDVTIYRVSIKYCVFSKILIYFPDSVFF